MKTYNFYGDKLIDMDTGEIVNPKDILEDQTEEIIEEISRINLDANRLNVPMQLKLSVGRSRYGNKIFVPINKNQTFNKIFESSVDATQNITDSFALAFIAKFLPYLSFPENCIKINKEYPTFETMGRMLGIKKSKFYKVMSDLEELDIIQKRKIDKNNVVYFNPFLYCGGAGVSVSTYRLFADSPFNTLREP